MKRFQIASIAFFVTITVFALALSYTDRRPVDGNLELGFPLVFYFETAGFGGPVVSDFDMLSLFGDLFIYFGISVTVAYILFRKQ